jgi:hypothetical protein
VMDKPNSCVVANTQIKPGISRQVRAMRKLEYVRFISLSPGGGPKSREIIMNDRLPEWGSGDRCLQAVVSNRTRLIDRGMVKIDRIPASFWQ